MDTNKLLETISKKLGVLIALNLISMNSKATVTENIEMLDRFGLTPIEISEILNTSSNTVNVTRSRLKKKK
ncbi:sigma-70 family RNA polymerase sigma factor [Patescibacteria group bacterium]|nr:sigma-70 family RNA polymerase sigma factor [Patescibacteria group bacterium]